jgi:hypothetical protein
MNPYLEHPYVWHDFHFRFIAAAADALTAQVRPHYIVKIDAHIYLHELPDEPPRLLGRGDANVIQVAGAIAASAAPAATIEAPLTGRIELPVDVEKISYLEIVDREFRDVVTVVELLSPANKQSGSDREQYLGKRRQLLRSDAHLVEIDLLRDGPRMPVTNVPRCDYLVLVSRAERRPEVQLWPIQLRQPVPVIPVPLKGESEANLDVQSLIHRVYDTAGYADYLYSRPIQPPLNAADAAWAASLLTA